MNPPIFLRTTANKIRRAFQKIDFGTLPHIPVDAGLQEVCRNIQAASVYLEYGAGGSTVYAAQYADVVVTLESDRAFLSRVAGNIEARAGLQFLPIHAAIGTTYKLGYPAYSKATPRRIERWKTYPQLPWKSLRDLRIVPDVILVDGRFRVACTLESLIRLPPGDDCLIMIDDFAKRPHYRPVLEFARDVRYAGRLLLMKKADPFDDEKCRSILDRHYADSR